MSITNGGYSWLRPTSLAEVHGIFRHYGHEVARLVGGNTSIGITKYFREAEEDPKVFIDISRVPELHVVDLDREGKSEFGLLCVEIPA